MQQPAASTSPSPTFAGVLASFAASGQKRPPARDLDGLDLDGLEDDVATLSYECALRTHGRPKAVDAGYRAQAPPTVSDSVRIFEVPQPSSPVDAPVPDFPLQGDSARFPQSTAKPEAELPAAEFQPAFDRNLKSASITIRLSQVECAQLRQRAAQAGLTVSAYLRSCTFEAESLRALVKDTLAQLHHEPSQQSQDHEPTAKVSRFGWLRWIWPGFHRKPQAAHPF